MEQSTRNNRIVLIGGILVAVIVIAAIAAAIATSLQNRQEPAVEPNSQDATRLDSPFSEVSDNLLVGYDAVAEPNEYAAATPFRLYGYDNLKLSNDLKMRLKRRLPEALANQIPPTFATTYIHIDDKSLDCASEYDCRFSFYVDSPESYFSFRLFYDSDGAELYEIEQQPLPEER